MATRYRIIHQKGLNTGFIMLQEWNKNLLLQGGTKAFVPGPDNRPKRRTPELRRFKRI